MTETQLTNLGGIFWCMKKLENCIPDMFSLGIALTDSLIYLKVTWAKGNAEFNFVLTRSDMEQLATDPGFEDFFKERMEAAYCLWEVGEE